MHDTIVIGGGPAGSTVGSLLRKYDPTHRVLILERERFPRDHVGESQLPLIGEFLDEMGVWDKVEAADFPIKVGATYRWGSTPDLWNFEFVPNGELQEEPRPAKYQGQRTSTAFQVDRAVYDKILLDHARELGCEVREETKVARVTLDPTNPDRIANLVLEDGSEITARHYVDATGGSGLVRRTMGVEVEQPTTLRNIAIWDYWQNAEWAVSIGVDGTRVQVLSLGYGWIWFIPLGPTRTSIGLIVPADYYKESGKRPEELYRQAMAEEPRVRELTRNAQSEGKLQTTNDWSYIADRLAGDNWFLTGDACGFADPILAAGMTLAHASAREVAYTILEIERDDHDAQWLKQAYSDAHRRRIRQHIRFADYWYTANGQFRDLVAYTSEIAKDSGLDLAPDKAFQWLGTGGFANDDLGQASVGAYSIGAVKQIAQLFAGEAATWKVNGYNEFRLNLAGVHRQPFPSYTDGKIGRTEALVRDGRILPLTGPFRAVYLALQQNHELAPILRHLDRSVPQGRDVKLGAFVSCLHALEAMVVEGWVTGKLNRKKPTLELAIERETASIRFDQSADLTTSA
jgi:flavin-dependent dehydrogenase